LAFPFFEEKPLTHLPKVSAFRIIPEQGQIPSQTFRNTRFMKLRETISNVNIKCQFCKCYEIYHHFKIYIEGVKLKKFLSEGLKTFIFN
jgi:hypothetical protein